MKEQFPFESTPRIVFVKKKAKTDKKFGCRPEERSTQELLQYGIVRVNKPRGPTSHQVSAYVQQILGITKSGHSGTLDPNVTGLLPVALGRATRITEALLGAGKEYIALMRLHGDVPDAYLTAALEKFTGKIKQLPPVKSAVKRQWRYRQVYYLTLLERDDKDVLFKIGCEAGTYIRKICHDIGKQLGCGAHMQELVRTRVGPFDQQNMVTLQDLTDAYYYYKELGNEKYIRSIVEPPENAVQHLPKIWVLDSTVESLCHGAILHIPGISAFEEPIEKDQLVALVTLKDELVCLGKAHGSSTLMKGEKGVAVKTTKVFMLPGTYPKVEKV
ncbi:RNA-guided pseudouridylation complex pseudouridine synthase subunit Cbf5 [Candidatus Woesearchaeota archaeon]|nr:RNA-guided pseudouridylation complex pseudouridine synthase subunit Cbf5 [Candidatus Woesearchaeota archaeon]